MPTKKNKGKVPQLTDKRLEYVSVGCGKCMECLKKKSREWQIRLQEEIRNNNECTFVTLTFSNEAQHYILDQLPDGQKYDNDIATWAVRHFLERWRKKYKISIKHWLITELGHKGTERIHLHGLIWTKNTNEITNLWQYGWVYNGQYVNNKTINYIIKYVTKTDIQHKWFKPKILTSPGIGKNYIKRHDSKKNIFEIEVDKETDEMYTTREGIKIPIPIYYRNKLYSEDEREYLWQQKLNKEERYVMGEKIKINTPEDEKKYEKTREYYRNKNKKLGFGDNEKTWDEKIYKLRCANIRKHTILAKIKKND